MWKKKLAATLILREINLRDLKSLKSAILTFLEALNFGYDEMVHFLVGLN